MLDTNLPLYYNELKQSRQDALSVTKWDVVCERKTQSAVSCRVRCIFILGIDFLLKIVMDLTN